MKLAADISVSEYLECIIIDISAKYIDAASLTSIIFVSMTWSTCHLLIQIPTSSSVFFQKHQAWCQISNGDWALGTILSSSGSESVISLPHGGVSLSNSISGKINCSSF